MIESKTKAIHKSEHRAYHVLKRLFDIIPSIVAIAFFSWLYVIIAVIIKISDPGPVFFRQTRIGKNGRPFKMWKFRSMVVNAEDILKENKELYELYLENDYKLKPEDNPRISKIGKVLRKSPLDELPQFFNILMGDMSLVGPRPVVKKELNEYGKHVDELLSIKPGAFGLWQASGRSNIGYPERCSIELDYVRNESFRLDLKIIFMTILSILKHNGAY